MRGDLSSKCQGTTLHAYGNMKQTDFASWPDGGMPDEFLFNEEYRCYRSLGFDLRLGNTRTETDNHFANRGRGKRFSSHT